VAIVRMKHVAIAGLTADREQFLECLQGLGVLHLTPCVPAPERSESSVELRSKVDRLQACLTMLDEFRHKRYELEYTDDELPYVLCGLLQEWKDLHQRLFALRHEVAVYTPWGDFDPRDIERTRELNLYIQLWSVPQKDYEKIDFDEGVYHKAISQQIDLLFCTVNFGKPVVLDAPVVELPAPADKLSDMAEKAHMLEERVKQLTDVFHQIASRRSVIVDALNELRTQLAFSVGQEGAYADETLFGIEGWVPATQTAQVRKQLKTVGRPVYVACRDPEEGEEPPVLTKEPVWARPARAFFDILGVVPGYTEYDISPIYIIAIALFTAMLIGDAGYGLLLLLSVIVFYKRLRYKLKIDPNLVHMLIILAAAISAYGLITMTIFGWTPADKRFVLLDGDNFTLMMGICFVIGAIHLSAAHLWRACRKFSEPVRARGLADLGWIAVVWAMYFLVLNLVLNKPMHSMFWPLFIAGLACAFVFAAPQKNVLKMVVQGLGNISPLNIISAFSDVISYVRLMAVGTAGVVMERAFNELAIDVVDNVVLTPLILVVAHTLVLALGAVAIFAHGVRLNLLEFSGHMDMMWSGRKYEPFRSYVGKETTT